jgi:hypothetical protein
MPKVKKARCRMRSTGHVALHTAAAMSSASSSDAGCRDDPVSVSTRERICRCGRICRSDRNCVGERICTVNVSVCVYGKRKRTSEHGPWSPWTEVDVTRCFPFAMPLADFPYPPFASTVVNIGSV